MSVRRSSLLTLVGGIAALAIVLGWSLSDFGGSPAMAQQKKNTKAKKKVDPPPPVPERKVKTTLIESSTRSKAVASAAKIDSLIEIGRAHV